MNLDKYYKGSSFFRDPNADDTDQKKELADDYLSPNESFFDPDINQNRNINQDDQDPLASPTKKKKGKKFRLAPHKKSQRPKANIEWVDKDPIGQKKTTVPS
jgi:hypothetical protein